MALSKNYNYALSNPLSVLLNKPPQDFKRSDFLKVIEEKGIERITFHYTALDGKLKELKIPVTNNDQAESILAEGERVDGSSLFKGMVDMGLSDLYVVPVFKTAFLNPFDDHSLDFICRYLTGDGELAPFALDNILARAAALFKKNTGLELQALGELEFFVLSERTQNLYPVQKQQGYHGAAPFIKSGQILNEMVHHIAQITGAVKYAHSEVGYVDSIGSDMEEIQGKRAEQLEIEFLPCPIADMADDVVLGRWIIRNIAHKYGCVATFTPKLEEGIAGNGLHFHLALLKNGKNIITGPDNKLTVAARRLIGGALRIRRFPDRVREYGLVGLFAARPPPGSADEHLLERPQPERFDPRSFGLVQCPPPLQGFKSAGRRGIQERRRPADRGAPQPGWQRSRPSPAGGYHDGRGLGVP